MEKGANRGMDVSVALMESKLDARFIQGTV